MTVYFIKRVSDETQVKIGSTTDLKTRLGVHASAFGDIRLFAQCSGGQDVERLYQMAFAHRRVEGEWFEAADDLLDFIAANAEPVDIIFARRVLAWTNKTPRSHEEIDSAIAASLMKDVLARYPATMRLAAAQEQVFRALHDNNPSWSRRRVRSIYQGTPRRVDLYEIRDLLALLGIERRDWPDLIDPPDTRGQVAAQGE